jgi:hypothetical protein
VSAIDFTELRFSSQVPFSVTNGFVQNAPGGFYRIDTLGDRWGFRFITPPVAMEPEGRRLQAMFDDAERVGGLFAIRQPGFDVRAPGDPVVSADTLAGKIIPIEGGKPNYEVRIGQWVSVVVGGQRYLDRVMERVVLDGSGAGNLRIKNLIRKPLSEGDAVELGVPKIEGSVTWDEPPPWDEARMTRFAFTVLEES